MENELGSIKVGKIANFTVLEQNPYSVPEDDIKDIEVAYTVFEGDRFDLQVLMNRSGCDSGDLLINLQLILSRSY